MNYIQNNTDLRFYGDDFMRSVLYSFHIDWFINTKDGFIGIWRMGKDSRSVRIGTTPNSKLINEN